jgi:hypothetical protein
MSWLQDLISKPYASQHQQEVEQLIAELIQIGKRDDFLSERPGAGFNLQCRNLRARAIGKRLDEIGGMAVMEYAFRQVRRKTNKALGEHLEYAWDDIGRWAA